MSHAITDRECNSGEKFISILTDKYPRIHEKLRGESFLLEKEIEITRRGRASKLEFLYRIMGDLAVCEVVEVFLILFVIESFVIPCCGRTIEGIYISSCISLLFLEIIFELDSCLFREDGYRFAKVDLLDLHKEIYRSTSLPTRETVCDIFLWRDDERRRFLTMKGAESFIVDSSFLGLHIAIHNIEDRDAGFDVLSERQWNE